MIHFDLNGTAKFPFYLLEKAQLGDIESAYAIFQKEYFAEELNTQLQPFQLENKAQHSENTQIKGAFEAIRTAKNN